MCDVIYHVMAQKHGAAGVANMVEFNARRATILQFLIIMFGSPAALRQRSSTRKLYCSVLSSLV